MAPRIGGGNYGEDFKNQYVSLEVIDKICDVLSCQPGDLIEHIPD
jgi:DNA-binding Xre family transcriptional regulator|nr:MAG TPA: Cro/C1-type HTH DNA-binding domain protein [Caudoviricetes sp.]